MTTAGRDLLQLPGVGGVFEIGAYQSPDRTDRHTLPALGAIAQVPRIDDGRLVTSGLDGQRVVSDDLRTGAYTLFAHDTERRIVADKAPVLHRSMLISGGEGLLIHGEFQGLVLQVALAALVTDAALQGMVDVVEFHDVLALPEQLLSGRPDHGSLHCLLHAGEDHPLDPFDLDDTHPAGADGLDLAQVAHGGDVDPVLPRRLQDGISLPGRHLFSVDGQRDRLGHLLHFAHLTPPPSKCSNSAYSAPPRRSPARR